MFSTKEEMQHALQQKRNLRFKGRELRVNRATEPKRREKKIKRKEAALQERRERRQIKVAEGDVDGEDSEELPPRNFGDAYSSEDSDDEKIKKRKAKRNIKFENSDFGKKLASKAEQDGHAELELNNVHRLTNQKKQALLSGMIQKGTSFKKEYTDR